jgi:hypothetical protein
VSRLCWHDDSWNKKCDGMRLRIKDYGIMERMGDFGGRWVMEVRREQVEEVSGWIERQAT